ncbi:MAG: hypothetical protein LBC18_08735 [Opitutaceae bacterium]|jgi:hypothetical protein|nr:hypothetical protein [Opitutaceae bacterium]
MNKTTLLALCLVATAPLQPAAPAGVPLIYQAARSNAPWNPATMIPLFDEPVDFGVLTTDFVMESELFFSDQNYERKRNFGRSQKIPAYLDGREFYLLRSDRGHAFECAKAGDIIGVAFSSDTGALESLKEQGFGKKDTVPLASQGDKFPDRKLVIHTRAIGPGEKITMPARTLLAGIAAPRAATGEVLYNNIVLPKHWPPHRDIHADEPPEIPYLKNRPKVVPIDIGRQLFVDDFLIEKTTLAREFHKPEKYKGNPVLKPETELEKKSVYADCPVAAPLGGSIWWNPDKQLFEIWYEAGHLTNLAYATSKDGLNWERPSLDVFPGTNKILDRAPDSWSVVYDFLETDPREKYKLLMRPPNLDGRRPYIYTSPDGIHWKDHGTGGHTGDRPTFFYNPFRKKWVFSLRWELNNWGIGRSRGYVEADTFVEGARWTPSTPVFWARADKLDRHYDDGIPENDDFNIQLYNIDTCAYESILISFFQLFHGPENRYWAARGLPKLTVLNFAYSRDGFNWDRPDRSPAIKPTLKFGDWDCGYVQSVGNLMAVRGDKLLIYYTGFAGDPSRAWDPKVPGGIMGSGMHVGGAMGVAILRRDGFASMNAQGEGAQGEGALTTRPVVFTGSQLFVNVDAPGGRLLAQVTGVDGKPIAPFTFENCEGVSGDTTIGQVKWKDAAGLSALAGRPVRFEFKLAQGKFYAFWVSRDESGRSDGYVAGGGPGFTSNIDTQGKNACAPNAGFMKQPGK